MTESKGPEGESGTGGSTGSGAATGEIAPSTERVPEEVVAALEAAAVTPKPSTDEEGENIDVEPVPMESSKPPPGKLATHHPPPPPSIRARGAGNRSHFEISGTPKVAQDLMSRKIMTIGPNDKLLHLEEHMEKFRFGHLPVIEDEKLVGLITHADLLHASASFLTQKAKELDEIIHSFPASRIMRRDLVTVRPTETLANVARLMWDAKVGCVLVTEESGKLVGIITEGDFIRLAHHFLVEADK